jgi:UDP-N-acetylmuramoyl-tripeptide--D-alanyl-D-alanine ligase
VVNADDPAAMGELARTRAERVETFGRAAGASYRLLDREALGEHGSRVLVQRPRRVPPLEAIVPLVGEAAAIDFVAALAATEAASGWTLTTGVVRESLASLRPPEGRAAVVALANGVLLLDDTYNANPASMRAAVSALADLARSRGGDGATRMVAILGEMKELGARAEDEHDALGALLGESKVALVISCGGLASRIARAASNAGVDAVDAPDVAAASAEALARVRPGDVVLVKGSRSVGAEAVVAALTKAHGVRTDEGTEIEL